MKTNKDFRTPLRELKQHLKQLPSRVQSLAVGYKEFLDKHYKGNYDFSITTREGFDLTPEDPNPVYVEYRIQVVRESHNVYHDDVEITEKIIVWSQLPYFGDELTTVLRTSRMV